MSSPTINVGQSSGNTSLETIMNLARALVNDTQAGLTSTPGEGQILVDNPAVAPFTQPLLNSAIRELYRELRNVGQPTLVKDNVIVSNIPPMQSPLGLGVDPAVQVQLSFTGFFDGTQNWGNILLPNDVIYVERVSERQSGTNNPFVPMSQPQFGLPSRVQFPSFSEWEWRNDSIWMVGATQTNDLRLRYWCQLSQFFSDTLDYASTFVPIIDCVDAVAYKLAVKYATMLGTPDKESLQQEAAAQMFQLKNAVTRRAQGVNYSRIPYGSYGAGSGSNNAGFVIGWQ